MHLFRLSAIQSAWAVCQSIFQQQTEQIYENIYEIDVTHNCAASEATEDYFYSQGIPRKTPYDETLKLIAEKQIKQEFRLFGNL